MAPGSVTSASAVVTAPSLPSIPSAVYAATRPEKAGPYWMPTLSKASRRSAPSIRTGWLAISTSMSCAAGWLDIR